MLRGPVDGAVFEEVVASDPVWGWQLVADGESEVAVLCAHGLPFVVDGTLDAGLADGKSVVGVDVTALEVLSVPAISLRDVAGDGVAEESSFPAVALPHFGDGDAYGGAPVEGCQ